VSNAGVSVEARLDGADHMGAAHEVCEALGLPLICGTAGTTCGGEAR